MGELLITPVVMPQMGLEVTEGTVAAIHVEVGQRVADGDVLVELETDKALTDVVAPHDGVVRAVEIEVGDTVPLGASLVVLAGADGHGQTEDEAGDTPAGASPRPVARTVDGRVRAAPVARRAAHRLGVDLGTVTGTGPRGRVTLRDVEAAAAANGHAGGLSPETAAAETAAPEPAAAREPSAASAPAAGRVEPMTGIRAAIARRMTRSQQIPQFVLEREVDASWLLEQKAALGAGVSDLLLQAMAEVVLRHPVLAASYAEPADGGRPGVLRREGADLGLAVATGRGLLVPVLRRVHERTLSEIAAERGRLAGAARSGRLSAEEMSGGFMTLSNLAGFGVDRFTAMLNPGESSILAVGRVVERVVPRGRAITVAPMLSLSLTLDHRVADGAAGAAALVELAALLEGDMTWRS